MHPFKSLAPLDNLVLNLLPFLSFDLTQLVRFDNDFLILLVNLGVDDLFTNGFNSPLLNLVGGQVKQSSQLGVLEVGLVGVERANLHVALFEDEVLLRQLLLLHQLIELRELFEEVLRVSAREQAQKTEYILAFLQFVS